MGEKPEPRILSGTLPAGAKFVLSDQDTSYVGARVITVKLLDKKGDVVARYNLTLAVVSPASTLLLPTGLKVIEGGAFENAGAFLTLVIPPSVDQIGSGAFAQSQPAVVFCADPGLVSGMFGGNTVIVNDPDAYYRWAND